MSARASRAAALAAALLLSVVPLAACEHDDLEEAMAAPATGSGSVAEVCAKDAKAVALPSEFPTAATLPEGYIVTGVESRSQGRTVVTGVSPKAFADTLKDVQAAYSSRGWTLSEGEVEDRDAESNFSGNGLRGRWAIRTLPDCTDNTMVSLLIGP